MEKPIALCAIVLMVLIVLTSMAGCQQSIPDDVPQESVVMVQAQYRDGSMDQHSGFIISPDGYIFTFLLNRNELENVEVVLNDGRSFQASIPAIDTLNNAARIKIETTSLSPLVLPEQDVELGKGDAVVAAGYIDGKFTTETAKIVQLNSVLPSPWAEGTAIKLDTGAEPGMVGGPVVDTGGHLIGAVLAIDPKTGESFMVPKQGIISMFFPTPEKVPPPSPSSLSTPESQLPFEAGISTSNDRYLPGEQVMYGIGIMNLSSGIITIDPFPPAMWIKPVGQDEAVYSSAAGTRTHEIVTNYPSSWYRTKGVWDQKDNNGAQVPPGWYEITYEYVIVEKDTSKRYTVRPTARFQIVPSDSAMAKDLDINQSVAAEGLTVILERVELDAVKVTVYIFTTPPGYTLPQAGSLEESASFVRQSAAEYRVDGSGVKRPVDIRAQFNKDGARLIWRLDPIPVNAKELTFTITRLGGQEGRWEFKVQLN